MRLLVNKHKKKTLYGLPKTTGLVDWEEGVSESLFMSLTFFFFIGIFLFLSDFVALLLNPTTIFYIILLLFGITMNIPALIDIRKNITTSSVLKGIGLGFICLIVLSMMGLIFNMIPGFTLLETTPVTPAPLTFVQRVSYQVTFVAFAEELVYRNTLPQLISTMILEGIEMAKKTPSKNVEIIILTVSFEISSLLFGFTHYFAYGGNMMQVFIAFIAGTILSMFRIIGNLFSTTFAHLLYNLTSISLFSLSPQL